MGLCDYIRDSFSIKVASDLFLKMSDQQQSTSMKWSSGWNVEKRKINKISNMLWRQQVFTYCPLVDITFNSPY